MPIVFDNDDAAYLNWLATHPDGYVINRRRGESSGYMVLHRSECRTISRHAQNAHLEGFTGRGYLKVCATTVSALDDYTRVEGGRPDGGFSSECSICRPCDIAGNSSEVVESDLEAFDFERDNAAPVGSFLAAIRAMLSANPTGLTPQEMRRLIKSDYPFLYGTEAHRRNVARGHYADLEHALLAQIYSSCRNARDLLIDRTTKPLRYRLSSPVELLSSESIAGRTPSLESGERLSRDRAGAPPSPQNEDHGSTGTAAKGQMVSSFGVSDFDIERARNAVVRICFQLWRATQEGDPPRVISATIHHLRTCEIIPYVTASLMLTVCAVRNATVYSEWSPSLPELNAARHAFDAIDVWWLNNPLRPGG